ncbi:MAG: hypothetical protein QNJ75_07750 [Acidimicrobiia bacterium]|nr:hypothetical protein [Acidimicrobiia bacterium]
MLQTLVTIHSWTRWLVLAALLGAIVLGSLRFRDEADWSPHFHQVAVMVIDVQVAIGAVIWLFYDGAKRGFFYAVLHPVAMLLALGVAHAGFGIAKRRNEPKSWLIATISYFVALLLIIAAIPWDRL